MAGGAAARAPLRGAVLPLYDPHAPDPDAAGSASLRSGVAVPEPRFAPLLTTDPDAPAGGTTIHENRVERAELCGAGRLWERLDGALAVSRSFPLRWLATPINRPTRADLVGTTLCRTRKREGRMAVSFVTWAPRPNASDIWRRPWKR
jgi:hypothetical protein